jgi:sugar fermentation stimulation protein A
VGPYEVKREAKFNEGTRFDFCLSAAAGAVDLNAHIETSALTWIEVKSVSLRLDAKTIAFPDAVTERGQKHLKELCHALTLGARAFLFFAVMRGSDVFPGELAKQFRAAAEIDPKYAQMLAQAVSAGVQVRIVIADIQETGLGVRGYFKYSQ